MRQAKQANKSRQDKAFLVGSEVLLNTKNIKVLRDIRPRKFAPPFEGPFKIVAKFSNNVYQLDLPPGSRHHDKFHVSLLRPYVQRPNLHREIDRPPRVEYNTDL